jgi:hypothetical protein
MKLGEKVNLNIVEYYVIGDQKISTKFVEVVDSKDRVIRSDFFRYPVSLSDMRVKIDGVEDSTKVGFLRVDSDTIKLTTYKGEDRAARYLLPKGKATVIGESGQLHLPVKDISYGYVSVEKQGRDVVGIKPITIELHTSIGVSVVTDIVRSMDKDKYIIFELEIDLAGWINELKGSES